MKKTNITIAYAEEKLAALNLYLSQKTLTVEEELGKALDALYTKNVPAGVRKFIELRAGLTPASASTPKATAKALCPLLLWARFPQPGGEQP